MLNAHGSGGSSLEDVLPLLAVLVVAAAYGALLGRTGRSGPPFRRVAGGAALLVLAASLSPPLEQWAHRSLTGHMVQHLLISSLAAPLLALAAPVSLLLRASRPARRRRTVRLLQAAPAQVVGHPAFGWGLYLVVLWGAHLSPLYQAALETPALHALEHMLFLAAGYLLWVHVVGADPLPHRLSLPARAVFLVASLPPQSFLGLTIYSAGGVLYPHYGTGAAALADQKAGGLVMWLGGDAVFLAALIAVLALWVRSERPRAAPHR